MADCSKVSIGLPSAGYVRPQIITDNLMAAKANIVPRDTAGNPSTTGKIGMIMIGMSNARLYSAPLYQLLQKDLAKHPAFTLIRAAQSGKTAEAWSNQSDPVWATANYWVTQTGFTPAQVQSAYVVMTQRAPDLFGPMTKEQLHAIVANLKFYYPNLAIAYLSGINYTKYSDDPTQPNGDQIRAPEPFVHNDSVLIADAVTNDQWPVAVDFYDNWSDGLTPNPETGLIWRCEMDSLGNPTANSDVDKDGVHPTLAVGSKTMATSIKNRWWADPTTLGWMRKF